MKDIKLPKIKEKNKKRVGRGYGSGRGGHTSGRGQKGQKTRRNINVLFEGVKVKKSLIKKLPFQRGKGKFKAGKKPLVINIKYLNILPSGSKVNLNLLVKENIVKKEDAEIYGVKILGDGEISKKLIIELPISNSAAKKVEKAGGSIVNKDTSKEKSKKTIKK
jgi:large subunit ribosomal protein L15